MWYLNIAGVLVWYDMLAGGALRDLVFPHPAFLSQLMRSFVHSTESTEAARSAAAHQAHKQKPWERAGSSLAELVRSGTERDRAVFYDRLAALVSRVHVAFADTSQLASQKWPPSSGWHTSTARATFHVTLVDQRGSPLTWQCDAVIADVFRALGLPPGPRVNSFVHTLKGMVSQRKRAEKMLRKLVEATSRLARLPLSGRRQLLVALRVLEQYAVYAKQQGWVVEGVDEEADETHANTPGVHTWFHSRRRPTAELRGEYVTPCCFCAMYP